MGWEDCWRRQRLTFHTCQLVEYVVSAVSAACWTSVMPHCQRFRLRI